jgi:hypothetical protein
MHELMLKIAKPFKKSQIPCYFPCRREFGGKGGSPRVAPVLPRA